MRIENETTYYLKHKRQKTMKRLIGIMALLLALQSVWAGNVGGVFNEFKDAKHADYVYVSPFLMKLGKMFMRNEDKETYDMVRNVSSVQVLDLEECSTAVKQRFTRRIARLNRNGYETMVRVNDEGEKVGILTKTKGDVIREMLIVCSGQDDCVLVRIKGKFKESDIDKLVAQHMKDSK